jgi:NTP pyrophosphatase (non-canonical NTP hydrolase)
MIPREEVQWFAEKMEEKLRVNDHKGGWQAAPTWWLVSRLKEETIELERALERVELSETQVAFEHAMGEAVDVSNFAMMIGDVLRKRMEEKQDVTTR